MENIISGSVGGIHLIAAITAIISGTVVFVFPKGTQGHKRVGYIYIASMIPMLVSSFMLYNLFGSFGVFHMAAVLSSITLLGGMVPLLIKLPKKNGLYFHFAFMYWSVIGLYAAFFAEVFTRIPETPFYLMVGVASGLTFGIGGYIFKKRKAYWIHSFVE